MKKIIKHAGKYHYSDCKFPTEDQAVCNCPNNLKPMTPKQEEPKEEKWEKELLDKFGSDIKRDAMCPLEDFIRQLLTKERKRIKLEYDNTLQKRISKRVEKK